MSDAIEMQPKIAYWGRKMGGFIRIEDGKQAMVVKIKRGGPGKNKNSGPVGKRKTRFYQGAYGQRPAAANKKVATPRQALDNAKAAAKGIK